MKALRFIHRAQAGLVFASAVGWGMLVTFLAAPLHAEETLPRAKAAQIRMVETNRDLAAGLTCEGKFQQAELKLHALLKQSEQLLGGEHPQTLLCQRALGILYLSQSRFNEAETKFRLVLQTQSSLSQGREAGRTCFLLALALAHQGKFTEAEAYSQFAFQEAQAELGPDYPTTLLYRGLLRQLQDDAREFSHEKLTFMSSNS